MLHDVRGWSLIHIFLLHEVHVWGNVTEEHAVTLAEIVFAGIAVDVLYEAGSGAFAVAGKLPFTLLAFLWQRLALETAELLLLFAVEHFRDGLLADVAEAVFGEDEVVAGIDVAVEFHNTGMAAFLGIDADARRDAHPVGKDAVEELDVSLAYIITHPLIEDGAEETSPLLRRNREIGNGSCGVVSKGGKVSAVSMIDHALHNGRNLNESASHFLEEMIEVERVVGIEVVDHRHGVPFHVVLVEQLYATHHLCPRRTSACRTAILVMKLLRIRLWIRPQASCFHAGIGTIRR